MEIVAHRGALLGVSQNTILAFERAVELGAEAIRKARAAVIHSVSTPDG